VRIFRRLFTLTCDCRPTAGVSGMARIRYEALLPQFSVIVERRGVEISRDVLSAVDAASARTMWLSIRPARLFDPLDKAFVCRVERFVP